MNSARYSAIFLVCVICSSYSFAFKLNAVKPNENEINLNEIKFVDNYYIQNVQSGFVIGAVISAGERPFPTTMVALEEAANNPELQAKILWNLKVTAGIPALTNFITVGPNNNNNLQEWQFCVIGTCAWVDQVWVLVSRGNSTWGITPRATLEDPSRHCLTAYGQEPPDFLGEDTVCDISNDSQTWRLVKVE